MHSTNPNNDSIKIGTVGICSDMQSNVHKILAEGDNCVEMEGVARTRIISRIKFILLTLSLYFGISYHHPHCNEWSMFLMPFDFQCSVELKEKVVLLKYQ